MSQPTPSTKAERGERRAEILAAALACFNEHGVEAAAIGDICARAGASIGSVYHHFGSKEGIAAALLVDGLRSNVEQLRQRLHGVRGARAGIRALVASLVDWVVAHPDWARFIYTVSPRSAGAAGAPGLSAVNEDYRQLLDDCFGAQLKAGALRRLPRECLPSLLLGPVHDYARRWLGGQVSTDPRELVEVFANAAWLAVRAPPAP